jgi:hypothetical protein
MKTTKTTPVPSELLNAIYEYFVINGYENDSKMHYLCEKERELSIALLPFIEQEFHSQEFHPS